MGIRSALAMFRQSELWPGVVQPVPAGALRPSMTLWYDPGGAAPPVSWVPGTGEFETHWDWAMNAYLALPGVWRARLPISQSIGAMPIGAWRDLAAVTPLPSLLAEPNPGEDRANTVAAWVCDLLDHGNAFGIVTGVNAEGKPTSVEPVPCANVGVGRTETGRLVYTVGGNTTRTYDRSEVFHAKGMSAPGALRGMGVLEAGMATLDRLTAEARYAGKAFNSGVPSGLLRVKDPDLQVGTDDDDAGYATAKGIKKAWQASVGTGDVAVLSELVDFTPLSWTPSDAQMVEARQLSLVDVANMFNLDPYWVGASQVSAPYQNVQQAALQLSRFTLGFWITALEAQFSRMLPRGQEAKFERDTILRDDQSTRVANYKTLVEIGALTVDEVRAREGLPPLEEPPPAPVVTLVPDGDTGTNKAVNQ